MLPFDEVVSVETVTIHHSDICVLRGPTDLYMSHVKDAVEEKYYYRTEIVGLTKQKIYYIGIGVTPDAAIENLFRSLQFALDLPKRSTFNITSPRALQFIRERHQAIQQYIKVNEE